MEEKDNIFLNAIWLRQQTCQGVSYLRHDEQMLVAA